RSPPPRHPRPNGRPPSPSFPCSSLAVSTCRGKTAPRAEQSAVIVHFLPRACAPLGKARGLPHLKFRAQADKRDMGGDSGVRAKGLRKHDKPVLIDQENVHISLKRDRQLVSHTPRVSHANQKPRLLSRNAL